MPYFKCTEGDTTELSIHTFLGASRRGPLLWINLEKILFYDADEDYEGAGIFTIPLSVVFEDALVDFLDFDGGEGEENDKVIRLLREYTDKFESKLMEARK